MKFYTAGGAVEDGSITFAKLDGSIDFTALTPAASVTIPADVRAGTLTPNQATEIDLTKTGVDDGTTKILRVSQGGTGYAITFAAGIAELGAASASSISSDANKVSYVTFIFNSADDRWEAYSVVAES